MSYCGRYAREEYRDLSKGFLALGAFTPTTLRVLKSYCLVLRSSDLGTVILPGLLHPRSKHEMTLLVDTTRLTKNFERIVVLWAGE